MIDPDGLLVKNPKNYRVHASVLDALWELNRLIGCDKDIIITDGDRPAGNEKGAGNTSQHVVGRAADFYVPGQTHLLTANQALESGLFGGVGWYEEGYRGPTPKEGPHVHVDMRDVPYSWGLPKSASGTRKEVKMPRVPVTLDRNNCGCK